MGQNPSALTSLDFIRFDTSQLRLIYVKVLLTLSFIYLSPHRGWGGGKPDFISWVKVLELLNKFEAVFTLRFVWYQVRLEGRVAPVVGFLDVGNNELPPLGCSPFLSDF